MTTETMRYGRFMGLFNRLPERYQRELALKSVAAVIGYIHSDSIPQVVKDFLDGRVVNEDDVWHWALSIMEIDDRDRALKRAVKNTVERGYLWAVLDARNVSVVYRYKVVEMQENFLREVLEIDEGEVI